jgi:hypothetical protein
MGKFYVTPPPPPPNKRTLGCYAKGASPILYVPMEIFLFFETWKKWGNKKRVVQAYLKEWCHQTFDLELYYEDLYNSPTFKKTQKPCIIIVYDRGTRVMNVPNKSKNQKQTKIARLWQSSKSNEP